MSLHNNILELVKKIDTSEKARTDFEERSNKQAAESFQQRQDLLAKMNLDWQQSVKTLNEELKAFTQTQEQQAKTFAKETAKAAKDRQQTFAAREKATHELMDIFNVQLSSIAKVNQEVQADFQAATKAWQAFYTQTPKNSEEVPATNSPKKTPKSKSTPKASKDQA